MTNKRISYKFVCFLCFLTMVLLTSSCGKNAVSKLDGYTPENYTPGWDKAGNTTGAPESTAGNEAVFDAEYFRTATDASTHGEITPDGYVMGNARDLYELNPPEGKEPKIIRSINLLPYKEKMNVKITLTNTHKTPNMYGFIILCDGLPVKFSVEGCEGETYFYEHLLYGDEELVTTFTLQAGYSPELGRLDVQVLNHVYAFGASGYKGDGMRYCVEFPEGYAYIKPETVKLKNVPRSDAVTEYAPDWEGAYTWFLPVQTEFLTFRMREDMGLGGVKKLNGTFITDKPGIHRTVFFLNYEPVLNYDGSILIVEWEAGPDEMALYTLELDNLPDEGRHSFFAVTIPLENTEYYSPVYSERYGLTLDGRFLGNYRWGADFYIEY